MLGSESVIAFVPTTNPTLARTFYEQTLGLEFVSDDGFALIFKRHGTVIRVVNVACFKEFRPAPFTILGWHVANVEQTVSKLAEGGIVFERFAGMEQSPLGIWRSPNGAQVAWFKDPDGNVLSISGD